MSILYDEEDLGLYHPSSSPLGFASVDGGNYLVDHDMPSGPVGSYEEEYTMIKQEDNDGSSSSSPSPHDDLAFNFHGVDAPLPAGWNREAVKHESHDNNMDQSSEETLLPPHIGGLSSPTLAAATTPAAVVPALPTYSNAHIPSRQIAKNLTPQPPIASIVAAPARARGVKREAPTPVVASIASPMSQITSPVMASSTPSGSPHMRGGSVRGMSSSSSAGSNSGGSGVGSEVSDGSDSDDSGFEMDEADRKQASKHSPSNGKSKQQRKRKSGSGANSDSNSDPAMGDDSSFGFALPLDPNVPVDMTGQPLVGDKRQQRLQRNRASAQLSRERKKQYMKLLEKQLKEMSEINEGLTVQITALTTENTALKARLAKLTIRERVAQRYSALNGGVRTPNASSSNSSLPGLSSPSQHSSCSSEGDSNSNFSGSTPATPRDEADADGSSMVHQAKKLKVAAYASPNSSPSPRINSGSVPSGFNARTSMLLFTLVMSVGLFYNIFGVDMPHDSLSRSLGHAGGATIEPIEEVRQLVSIPRAGQRVLASLPEPSAPTTTNVEADDAFALVPLAAANAATATGPVASTALVSNDVHRVASASAMMTKSIPSLNTHLLQKLMLQGNLTHDANSQYLYCPDAIRITRRVWNGMMSQNESLTPSEMLERQQQERGSIVEEIMEDVEGEDDKQVALFDRAGRARGLKRAREIVHAKKNSAAARLRNRLPVPLSNAAALPAPGEGESEYSIPYSAELGPSLTVGDKLLLWLPLHTVNPSAGMNNGSHATGASNEAKGMVEIACSIAHVRPILLS